MIAGQYVTAYERTKGNKYALFQVDTCDLTCSCESEWIREKFFKYVKRYWNWKVKRYDYSIMTAPHFTQSSIFDRLDSMNIEQFGEDKTDSSEVG